MAVTGVLALIVSLPTNRDEKPMHLASEIGALANGKRWLSQLMNVFFAAVLAAGGLLVCLLTPTSRWHKNSTSVRLVK